MVPSKNEAIQIRDMKDLRYAAVCHIDGLGSSRVHFIKGATCDDQDTVPVWMGQRGVLATQPPPKVTDPFRARSVERDYKSFPTTMAPLSRARNGRCAIRGQARENSEWSTQLDVAA